ncbi:MAG: peptidylprolyl isomerase [Candidatus Bathyarchaeia archaeon]|jgi:cyclophilin family peptidyl-prolyl cis-trans isomerase
MAPKKKRQNRQTPKKSMQKKSNKTTWYAIGAIAIILIIFGVLAATGSLGNHADNTTPSATPVPTQIPASSDPYANATQVLLHTSMGDITVALRNDMPITTGNFINLTQQGIYDNTIFHRVIEGFMIQGGDPAGTGYGDGSIPSIQDEFTTTNHNYNGTIAMAKTAEPNSATSQFFINVADNNNRYSTFDSSYSAFGKVISGMDVAMAISKVAVVDPTQENYKPVHDVTLISATVLPELYNP